MSFNAKDMTQGGQIASMRIRMFSQIANIMLYCLFIFFWILVGLILWVKISWQTFVNGCIYWWCTTLEGMRDLIMGKNKLADVCERLYLLVVYHAGRHAGFNQVPASI
ncbi:hypothetical protein BFD65_25340 [Escherichia coli]|nr:hypothetical protein BFD65_25340 [Escherichia coli]